MGIVTPGQSGTCPQCKVGVRFESPTVRGSVDIAVQQRLVITSAGGRWIDVTGSACPVCNTPILAAAGTNAGGGSTSMNVLLWPDASGQPVPREVEVEDAAVAADFNEAVAVLPKSSKACAALARRCLQAVLVRKGGAKQGASLSDQIEAVLKSLPHSIADNVDAVRQVGNFAAHPMKSLSTGEIVEVEPGEADWLLEVLEELGDLGKPPLKSA